MSPHTPEPLSDKSYWRRLLATVHPDRDGGDGELFVFLQALKEHIDGCIGHSVTELHSHPRCRLIVRKEDYKRASTLWES